MNVSEKVPLLYGFAGGEPPASFVLLCARADGWIWHLSAAPWPVRRPFDTIGTFATHVGANALRRLLDSIDAGSFGGRHDPVHADSGTEHASVWLAGSAHEAEWNPNHPPAAMREVVRTCHAWIDRLYQHPVCVLRGALAFREGRVALVLTAAGTEDFSLRAFFASDEAECSQVRATVRVGAGSDDTGAMPAELYGEPVLDLDASGASGAAWGEPGTWIAIAPGEEVTLPLPIRVPSGPSWVYALTRVAFRYAGLDGATREIEGWMYPASLSIAGLG